jgi:hypothetical protein
MEASVSGSSQSAFGELGDTSSAASIELFATGIMRIPDIPTMSGASHLYDRTFLKILDDTDFVLGWFYIRHDGTIYFFNTAGGGGSIITSFNILGYENVPIIWSLWVSDEILDLPDRCVVKLFINGEEVFSVLTEMPFANPRKLRFGFQMGATNEAWAIQFGQIEIYDKYYDLAYQVKGYPFDDINEVYIDGASQPDERPVTLDDGTAVTQYIDKFPSLGMVVIRAEYPSGNPVWNYKVDGEIKIKVIENAGGRHALQMIELLVAEAGLTSLMDADALAAAYLAVPDDILTGARFEGSGENTRVIGLKDYSSFGMTIADCIKEICSRMMYWFFMEGGLIKIIPYTGVAPASPADLALDGSSLFEASPTIDFSQVRNFVAATYGWYERNNALFYIAGTPVSGGDGVELDFTWQSPVASESRALVVAKADLLNIFSSAQEIMDPVRTHLIGARVELMKDVVSIDDEILSDAPIYYWVNRKEIALDPDEYQVSLQPLRILGEI